MSFPPKQKHTIPSETSLTVSMKLNKTPNKEIDRVKRPTAGNDNGNNVDVIIFVVVCFVRPVRHGLLVFSCWATRRHRWNNKDS